MSGFMQNHIPAVTALGLTKKFGDFTAVRGVSFDVYPGEIFGFLGPNGSGKTTTIRMTLGLLKPSAGSVSVLGLDTRKEAGNIRPRVGYMSQRFSLYNDLTVMQNLRFYGAAYGLEKSLLEVRIQEALKMSGLEGREDTQTRALSGGWRQRLALSAAILHRPEVLFLDEPTAGVDPISRRAFWDLLYQLVTPSPENGKRSSGVCVFVTTHYMDEAEHCHRLAFIQHGEIIAYGSPADIKRQAMQGQVLEIAVSDAAKTVRTLRRAQADQSLPIDEVELYGSLVHVIGEDIANHTASIAKILEDAQINIEQMEMIAPSLEDVFIACMKP